MNNNESVMIIMKRNNNNESKGENGCVMAKAMAKNNIVGIWK